jgi:phage terminase large subunit-like protein
MADDPTFALVEYRAPDGCAVDDRDAWKLANPALGDFLYEDGMATEARTVRESAFRQFRLGQWPTGPMDAWMDPSLWSSRSISRTIPDGAVVVLALDGSFSQDSTALVAWVVGDAPHLDVVGLWESPNPSDETYRIDVLDVEDEIRAACRQWRVLEVTADPFRWQRSLQVLADERIPVSEYPQSPARMTPATQGLYEAVVNGTVTHSGDKRLARHVANAVLRVDTRGSRLVKESKHSRRRIDLSCRPSWRTHGRSNLPADPSPRSTSGDFQRGRTTPSPAGSQSRSSSVSP